MMRNIRFGVASALSEMSCYSAINGLNHALLIFDGYKQAGC